MLTLLLFLLMSGRRRAFFEREPLEASETAPVLCSRCDRFGKGVRIGNLGEVGLALSSLFSFPLLVSLISSTIFVELFLLLFLRLSMPACMRMGVKVCGRVVFGRV